jgi:hypothetical protein
MGKEKPLICMLWQSSKEELKLNNEELHNESLKLPKHISSLADDYVGSQTSNSRFYLYIAYLVVGFAMALFSNNHNFMQNYLMIYFFGLGIVGMITYHLYAKNPRIGVTFNNDSIRIQSSLFKKKYIPLSGISSVSISLSFILIKMKNGQTEKIELSGYAFGAVKELKEYFREYTFQNKIECEIK